MKRWVLHLLLSFILIIIFVVFSFSKAHAASLYDIVFSEVMWMGSNVSSSDEWIELYNNSSINIDLSGWQITKLGDSGEELILEIPSGIIPANGYFLISNNSKDHKFTNGESILNINPDFISSAVSLSNSKLQLKLYNGLWDDGRSAIDIVGDGKNPANFAGSNSTPKASMSRINYTFDGSIKENWTTTTTQKNLDLNISDLATPENSGKPEIEYFQVDQTQIDKKKNEVAIFSVKIIEPNNIKSVILDLSQIRIDLSYQKMCDEIDCGDQSPNDGIYTFTFNSSINDNCGNHTIPIELISKNQLTAESSTDINIIQTSEDVRINEISPKPEEGTDKEFIELYNSGKQNVDLYGWQLDDKKDSGANPYTINDRVINAKSYQVFYKTETKLTLNDSGDFVRLIFPNETESQSIEYGKSSKNISYNYTDQGWFWSSTITPTQENIITEPKSDDKTKTKNKEQNNKDPPTISISKIKNYQPETYVKIIGVVTTTPNLLAKTYFYIQDDSGGIQVYCYYQNFPNLEIGDKIEATGRFSNSLDRRIKITNADDINIIEKNHLVIPYIAYKETNYLDLEGMLVEISGVVTETSGDTFYVQDKWGQIIKIYIKKNTGIDKPKMFKGDFVKIIGIVDLTNKGFQILPVLQNHVRIIKSSKEKKENSQKNISLISTAYAANNGKISSTVQEKKFLGNYQNGNIKSIINTTVKIIISICIITIAYLIGDYLWRNRIRLKI